MNKCCCCGSNATVGIDFIPYYDYVQGFVDGKFRQLNCFCDIHFLLSYYAFYMSTTVGWEISYSWSDNKEVRKIVADCICTKADGGHVDGVRVVSADGLSGGNGNMAVHSHVHNAWSDNRSSDTKHWKRRKGGKK